MQTGRGGGRLGKVAPEFSDDDHLLRTMLSQLRTRRVFFAHQSVGPDLIDGLRRVTEAHLDLAPIFVETQSAAKLSPGAWAHARLNANGEPLRKLRRLHDLLGALGDQADLVLFKLSPFDIVRASQVEPVHQELVRMLEALRTRHPGTLFAPMTVPLVAARRGPLELMRRFLGRTPSGAAENAARQSLNRKMRTLPGPLFDLARLQTTEANGKIHDVVVDGRRVPMLARSNTDDGINLNVQARVRIARALLEFAAAQCGSSGNRSAEGGRWGRRRGMAISVAGAGSWTEA